MGDFIPGDTFVKQHDEVVKSFFSRDETLWPILGSPEVKTLTAHYASTKDTKRRGDDPETLEAVNALKETAHVPEGTGREQGRAALARAVTRASLDSVWATPRSVENVASLPSDPAIVGAMLCNVANPNLVHHEYSLVSSDMEDTVVRQVASLAGMDAARAGGLCTSGGTMANLYGLLIAMRKAFPQSLHRGTPSESYRFLSSFAGHYSNVTVLRTLGVDTERGTLRIPINEANEMDCGALERALDSCFRLGVTVPALLLTMGTTDTFAADDIHGVRAVVDRVCALHGVTVRPHIHVDAAVGWAACFLNDYDVGSNTLGLTRTGRDAVTWLQRKFRHMHLADSFSADLHKLGYCPYPSSIFVVRNAQDLNVLRHDSNLFTYFKAPSEGHELYRVTVECSRSAVGVYSASLALEAMGKRGFQCCIANALQNAALLRALLRGDAKAAEEAACPEALALRGRLHVVPSKGPTVAFRAYEPGVAGGDGAAPARYAWECAEGGVLLDARAVTAAISQSAELKEEEGNDVPPSRLPRRRRQLGAGEATPSPLYPSNLFQERGTPAGEGEEEDEAEGPSLAHRLLAASSRGDAAAAREMAGEVSRRWAAYQRQIEVTSAFHRAVFDRRAHGGLFGSWVDTVTHSNFSDVQATTVSLPGEKLVFFNPHTSHREVLEYVRALVAAVGEEDRRWAASSGPAAQ